MESERRRRKTTHLLFAAAFLFVVDGACVGLGTRQEANGTLWLALLNATVIVQCVLSTLAIRHCFLANRSAPVPSYRAMTVGFFLLLGSMASSLAGTLWLWLHHFWTLSPDSVPDISRMFSGGAWGRPLRIRGRQLHPELRRGSDWTHGDRPNPFNTDAITRRALEALWLHDAQKEHASVPAFARVTWLLAAAGGPADLMAWAQRAGIEEIEHAQACFALAAGYGNRSHTVEPLPELLLGGLDVTGDPRVTLAIESLSDGCQLEDFNADVAAACAEVCQEPTTRQVLEKIAREERSHAELSWAILRWLVGDHRQVVEKPLRDADRGLDAYPRPTAVARSRRALVERADEAVLRAHGRLPDAAWKECWDARLVVTHTRFAALLTSEQTRHAVVGATCNHNFARPIASSNTL